MAKIGILSIIVQTPQQMRVKLKLSQLKKILLSEPLKLQISFKMKDFTNAEFSEFQKLIQSKERG
ncbi:hypothetical protein SAMN05444146_5309 [Flavobacterium johnsoniae]|nr:hypothetical protein SAMN05444146_5309 [Flavobacterium johnsoniae]